MASGAASPGSMNTSRQNGPLPSEMPGSRLQANTPPHWLSVIHGYFAIPAPNEPRASYVAELTAALATVTIPSRDECAATQAPGT